MLAQLRIRGLFLFVCAKFKKKIAIFFLLSQFFKKIVSLGQLVTNIVLRSSFPSKSIQTLGLAMRLTGYCVVRLVNFFRVEFTLDFFKKEHYVKSLLAPALLLVITKT